MDSPVNRLEVIPHDSTLAREGTEDPPADRHDGTEDSPASNDHEEEEGPVSNRNVGHGKVGAHVVISRAGHELSDVKDGVSVVVRHAGSRLVLVSGTETGGVIEEDT